MGKFVKFPPMPEVVGIVVIIVAWGLIWMKLVPANIKAKLS